jgi:hypothetical protein
MTIKAVLCIVLVAILALGIPQNVATGHQDPCKPVVTQYGNLTTETYPTSCFSLTPFYWKNGLTHSAAKSALARLGVKPLSMITGGFNTNLPGLREPVDYVEIEGNVIVGRSGFAPILYESNPSGTPYLGISRGEVIGWQKVGNQWRPVFRDLPQDRRWAIASWPHIKVKNGGNTFTVQFFGDDASGEPWLEYTYRRKGANPVLIKNVSHRKTWSYAQKRLIFDWTQRRAIFLNKDGTVFVIVKGRSDAISIGKLMVMLGYVEAILMDGGSATAPSALNPVYLVVTKRDSP